ncbi:extended synaptotagmin-2-like isoform X2 [Mya arenaria]|uniref:extended synaptotagmin-2-like isoform X2 n=1 Tax=Mya arenaria TaxID=6604 RepID=UPI0022DF2AE7|nr:extended synaptotagmin-2-like isoform X2 [Mya arenaria]
MANEKAPETPQKQRKRLAVKEDTLLIAVIKRYFKYAGAALAIWGFGYTQLSPAWILLGLVGIVWKEKHQKLQQKKIEISQQAAKNEKEAILARVEDLPSWVFFPDVERAEWMNKIIDQMWPFIGDYVQQLLMTSVQKTVQDSASIMGSFKFVNIDLGDIPPRIGGVKVYTEKVKRDEIYMDLDIIYSSDCEIEVKIKGISAGIKDLQLHGTVRVIMKPLISQSPFFGGLSVFFLNNPSIDFNLTNLANALDLPGLSDMLHTIIQENIANIMVLPNRIVVEMAKGVQITKLKFPQPDGVMRIHVLEAKELKKADISLTGKGKSDPYSVIRVGANKFKTPVINNSIAPQWNSVFETIIDERDGQFMDIEVRDEDTGGKDDKLGTVSVELSPVADKGTIDNWLPLENVKSGKLHLRLVWLYLSKDPLILNKSLQSNKNDSSGALGHDLSSCILMVSLDSARELPRTKKMAEPSPYVTINVGQKTETSNIVNDSTEPRWEQGFRFLVHDPNFQTVDLKVFDKKSDKSLGELSFPLKNLLTAPDLEVDRFFPLKKAEGNSEISVRFALRVLTTEQSPEWSQETENLMSPTADAQETNVDEGVTPISKPKVSQVSSDPNAGIKPATAPTNIGPIVSEKSGNVKGQIIPPAKSPGPARESEVRQRNTSTSGSLQGSHGVGRIQLTLRYSMQRGKLMVVVHKCTGLLACDKDNFSDPYVKMYLLPDKSSSSKRKTKVVNNNLNPTFDETFEYSITTQEMKEKQLEVTVKNDTSLFSSSQKELGVVIINLANMDVVKATTEWYDLCPEEMTKKETDI